MRKHISFAIAATILALAMIVWASASLEMPDSQIASRNMDPPAPNPNLPFQVLRPIY